MNVSDPEVPSPPILLDRQAEEDPFDVAYPEALREQEYRHVNRRRSPEEAEAGGRMPPNLVGVGLSGGGIRSATFSLGLFQGLAAEPGLLRQIDFLSTVSGGGYFGAFLGRLFSRDYIETAEDVEEVLAGRKQPQVLGFLRENGRYLAPNGAGDQLLAGASLLRNWVSIHLVLFTFGLAFFLAVQMLRLLVERRCEWIAGLACRLASGSWFQGSPYLLLPLASFVLAVVPLGWAFWLTRSERQALKRAGAQARKAANLPAPGPQPNGGLAVLTPWAGLLLVLVTALCLLPSFWGEAVQRTALLTTVSAVATVAWRLAVRARFHAASEGGRRPPEPSSPAELEKAIDWELLLNRWIPNRLGLWLTRALVLTGALLALAVVDSLGQSLYAQHGLTWKSLAPAFAALMAAGRFASQIAAFFSKGPGATRPRMSLSWIATAAALLLAFAMLVTIDTLSHGFVWGFAPPRLASPSPTLLTIALLVSVFLSLFFGQTWSFVNSSSYQSLYSARLTRAYLGASNEKRWEDHGVTEAIEGDDEDLARYWPPPSVKGAPIHLINVTINETIDGRSQIQQQDRKGIGMALGPCGMSAGVRHHLLLPFGEDRNVDPTDVPVEIRPRAEPSPAAPEFRVFEYPGRFTGEMLPLGSWVGISGAAFSTGTGLRTSLGLSLLAGMGNVRLGRWWDSGVARQRTGGKVGPWLEASLAHVFPVQTYVLDEFLARFPGTARRHWYLSDGGHFENMGGYELIRRRVHLLVIVDAEQDKDYSFEGLANLVRKARLDFGAEISFLDEHELDAAVADAVRPFLGTLDQLRRGRWEAISSPGSRGRRGRLLEADPKGVSQVHAALARITYSVSKGPREGWLLYIKPTLDGDEPADLVEYHHNHPDFPHESTLDQFFDEAQWESYRKLGQHIAQKLFASTPGQKWSPAKAMRETPPQDEHGETSGPSPAGKLSR